MHYKNILVPFDGSSHALEALECAREFLAENPESKVSVVMVAFPALPPAANDVDPGMMPEVGYIDYALYEQMSNEQVEASHKRMVAQAGPVLQGIDDARISYKTLIAPSVVDALVNFTNRNGIDLVVMGRRGLGAIRSVLGSVSDGMLRRVDIPVMTVK